jgi:thiol-disulfide isomerase/thioredoxin
VRRPPGFALIAVVAIAIAAGGGAYHWYSRDGAPDREPSPRAVAERVYAVRLADLAGGAPTLEQWRGQVLVVNFWATWCVPCREEIPGFVRLQERYGNRGLQFVGIALDQPDKVAEFAREFRINYPLLLGGFDTLGLLRQVGNRAGVLPYTLVIDRHGNVVSREPGGLKESRLEALLHPLL